MSSTDTAIPPTSRRGVRRRKLAVRVRWTVLVCAVAIAGAIALPHPALADELPQGTPRPPGPVVPTDQWGGHLTFSPMSGVPGDTIHATGECTFFGHGPTAVAAFFISADRLMDGSSDVPFDPITGTIDGDVVIPKEMPPGVGTIGWTCYADDQAFAGDEKRLPFTFLPSGDTEGQPSATGPTAPHGDTTARPDSAMKSAPTPELAATGVSAGPTAAALTLAGALGTAAFVAFSGRAWLSQRRRVVDASTESR